MGVPASIAASKDDMATRKSVKVKKATTRTSGNTLVVVESPAKAKTIKKYLGSGYTVKASVGHVMDLPKSKIGVDVENGFAPVYEVIDSKKKGFAELKAAAKNAEKLLLVGLGRSLIQNVKKVTDLLDEGEQLMVES